jgi:ABC-type nitrate/sulfonate/bicarbonate transport system substrate-binding protein
MRQQTRTVALLLLLATAAWAVPSLTIAYHREDHAAPLFDACLYPKDFRARYRLYLKEVKPRGLYTLVDGKRSTLSLRLVSFDNDSAVVAALRSDSAQVGILASEDVLTAVMATGLNVRIIAPLQQGGDLLVVNPSVPAADWKEFIAWVKARNRPTAIGYIGQYSMAALGLTQALEYEKVNYSGTVPGRDLSPKPESAKVKLVRADNRAALASELASGTLDAAVLQEPAATWVSMLRGCRAIGRTDILPPGRLEDRPGAVIAATGRAIVKQGEDLSRFLELMAVATHYANNRTQNTLAAVSKWLGTSPAMESIAMRDIGFSSRPDASFTTGIWNWYNALRLRTAVPHPLAMPFELDEKDWLRATYDSLLLAPALERAGARIVR